MDNKLLIDLLELLEETYPEKYTVGRLTKKLNSPMNGRLYQITKYLRETGKIEVTYDYSINERPLQKDRIRITNKGIEFLSDKKLLMSREKVDNRIKWATIVIAIATVANIIVAIFT